MQNWTVSHGSIDLIGEGPAGPNQDYYPGHGLYVDLAGSTGEFGTLTSNAIFGPGNYVLHFDIAGPHRDSEGNSVESGGVRDGVHVSFGSYQEDFRLDTSQTLSITTMVHLTSSAQLSFADLGESGNPNIGAILFDATVTPASKRPCPYGEPVRGAD